MCVHSGACFTVLASNKYKAQERLAQLKADLKGKTLTEAEKRLLKTAEVSVDKGKVRKCMR